jgi:hypothetical protein
MGIRKYSATAVANLRKSGKIGDDILCLGRPSNFLHRSDLRRIGEYLGATWEEGAMEKLARETYGEAFFRHCGFREIRSIDASGFEGAEIVHDLNENIPDQLKNIASFIFDSGTMEHIFNVPTSFFNVFQMLKPGGVVMFNAPANGQCGHGFYQFSPEFFHRLLKANGFDPVRVYIVSLRGVTRWCEATDPLAMRRRVEFMSAEPLQMIVLGRKTREMAAPVFPQQSDYAELAWNEGDAPAAAREAGYKSPGFFQQVKFGLVYPLLVLLRHTTGRAFGTGIPGLWRTSAFRPCDPFSESLL